MKEDRHRRIHMYEPTVRNSKTDKTNYSEGNKAVFASRGGELTERSMSSSIC